MKKNLLISSFILFIGSLLFISCGESAAVKTIKQSYFSSYPNKTIGEAVDSFFDEPEWESGKPADESLKDYTLVNCSGKIFFDDELSTAEIQFLLNDKTGEFELNALEINGVPQNKFMQIGLLEAMYE